VIEITACGDCILGRLLAMIAVVDCNPKKEIVLAQTNAAVWLKF
jgi:hypothetical protein